MVLFSHVLYGTEDSLNSPKLHYQRFRSSTDGIKDPNLFREFHGEKPARHRAMAPTCNSQMLLLLEESAGRTVLAREAKNKYK